VVCGGSSGRFDRGDNGCSGTGCCDEGRYINCNNSCCCSCRCCQYREVGHFVSEDHCG
jgi:hypothetical protein